MCAYVCSQSVAVYVGDDTSDEAAFRLLGNTGVSILVSDVLRSTQARYHVEVHETPLATSP